MNTNTYPVMALLLLSNFVINKFFPRLFKKTTNIFESLISVLYKQVYETYLLKLEVYLWMFVLSSITFSFLEFYFNIVDLSHYDFANIESLIYPANIVIPNVFIICKYVYKIGMYCVSPIVGIRIARALISNSLYIVDY